MKNIVFIITLLIIPSYLVYGQQIFEGKITYSVQKKYISPQDSIAYYQKLKMLFDFDIKPIKKEVMIKNNYLKDIDYNAEGLVISMVQKTDDKEVMLSPNRGKSTDVSKLPKETLRFVGKEDEDAIILGYKCRKYHFEVICMGKKDTMYLWIVDSFKPISGQQGQLFQRYLQAQGLVLKIEHRNKGQVTTITTATEISIEKLEDSIFELPSFINK